jgi:hypothetical protein
MTSVCSGLKQPENLLSMAGQQPRFQDAFPRKETYQHYLVLQANVGASYLHPEPVKLFRLLIGRDRSPRLEFSILHQSLIAPPARLPLHGSHGRLL